MRQRCVPAPDLLPQLLGEPDEDPFGAPTAAADGEAAAEDGTRTDGTLAPEDAAGDSDAAHAPDEDAGVPVVEADAPQGDVLGDAGEASPPAFDAATGQAATADTAAPGAADAGGPSVAGPALWSPCTSDEECPGGAWCNAAYPTATQGLCSPPGGLGWLCTRSQECSEGMTCVKISPTTSKKECHPKQSYGQPCSALADCPSGLVCNTAFSAWPPVSPSATTGVCAPPGRLGFPCRDDASCAGDHHCARPSTDSVGQCVPSSSPSAPCGGEADCTGPMVCAPGPWPQILQCRPPGDPAPPCDDDSSCAPGAVCVGDGGGEELGVTTPTCQPPGVFGSLCTEDGDCAPPFHCSLALGWPGGLGLCLPAVGGTGSPCNGNLTCVSGTTCGSPFGPSVEACAPPFLDGAPCSEWYDCFAPATCTDWYGTKACHPGLLAPCTTDSQCLPGLSCIWSFSGLDGSCRKDTYVNGCNGTSCTSTACNGCVCCACADKGSLRFDDVYCGQCAPTPGSRGPGSDCGRSADCAPGLACVAGPDGWSCAPGQEAGAPCSENAACVSGLVCVSDDEGSTCRPVRLPGETCDEPADCDAPGTCLYHGGWRCTVPLYTHCEDGGDCAPGFVCSVTPGGPDGSCSMHTLSVTGQYCEQPECGGYCGQWCHEFGFVSTPYECGQCIPAPGTVPLGQPCHDDGSCVAGAICAANGRCKEPGAQGGTCAASGECAEGLVCRFSTCEPPGGDGAPCETEADCEPELRCRPTDPNGHTCSATGSAGAGCDAADDCAPGLVCLGVPPSGGDGAAGTCGAPLAPGSSCAYASDCQAGLLCVGAPKLCAKDTVGLYCVTDADCIPGQYCGWCDFCTPL